jgi:nucleotide-binding universal stress UspA family protein
MNEVAKLLIAYDGSACSDAALNDLMRAGLRAAVEAVVVTAAEVILPPPDNELPDAGVPAIHIPEVERHARARSEMAIREARAFAERAAKRVKADFPGWTVKAEVRCDSPPWAVIKMADRLKADLVVVGSHKHSVVGGRVILGSVSQRVLYEARSSVRVARCSDQWREGPVRIIVGFDGSQDAETAVDAVAARAWPRGSEARVITAGGALRPEMHGVQVGKLRAAGLTTSQANREGDPAHVLIKEAEEWGADSIFVSTRDVHGFRHLLRGSVSSAVAARAQCSVEVVRSKRGAA